MFLQVWLVNSEMTPVFSGLLTHAFKSEEAGLGVVASVAFEGTILTKSLLYYSVPREMHFEGRNFDAGEWMVSNADGTVGVRLCQRHSQVGEGPTLIYRSRFIDCALGVHAASNPNVDVANCVFAGYSIYRT
jgi:hypothetical protein